MTRSTAKTRRRRNQTGGNDGAKSGHDSKTTSLANYAVTMVPTTGIIPSPENDDLYGEMRNDDQMKHLLDSIKKRGLEEPLILTRDRFILSGHRRFHAVRRLGWSDVPCRIRDDVKREGNPSFHKDLAEYNPQRVKKVGSLLKEALLRDNDDADMHAGIESFDEASCVVDVDFMDVDGTKGVEEISDKKMPFLEAVQKAVEGLREYWPLSIRQIHYNLLNDPPLTMTPKRSKFDLEHYRYRNDIKSYTALVRLLTPARYLGHISMDCIDDPTRPQITHSGFSSVDHFIQQEIDNFLCGYHRDRQLDQPRHIEILGEKNTLMSILKPIANEYYVPMSLGRGFCSVPVWKKMASRFRRSRKKEMTLIIVSDYDPEGLELADDAIRSLRDLWRLPVEGHRIAVTRDQIDEMDLAEDFNRAKETSSRFNSFVDRTGSDETWECEALPPDYLEDQVKAAIETNMNMELFEAVVEQEYEDCDRLSDVRRSIAGELRF